MNVDGVRNGIVLDHIAAGKSMQRSGTAECTQQKIRHKGYN